MRLTLIRHAESESNAAEDISGDGTELTALGFAQAKALGTRRPELGNTRLISSDMVRAQQTVETAFGSGTEITYDPRWRERDFGRLVGLTWTEASKSFPKFLDPSIPFSRAAYDWPAPDGESWAQMALRVQGAIAHLLTDNLDTVVVCHGGPIRIAVCLLLKLDPALHVWNFWPANVSIARLDLQEGAGILESWNDISHVPPDLRL